MRDKDDLHRRFGGPWRATDGRALAVTAARKAAIASRTIVAPDGVSR